MKIAVAALLLAIVGTSHAAQRDESAQPLKVGAKLTARNAVSRPEADTLIFDSFTGATYTTTGSSPRTFMGMGFNLGTGGGTNPVISRITVYMAATAAATYTNIRANVQLWDTYSQAADPVFSNAAGAQIVADLGPLTTTANTIYTVDIPLATPITLNTLANHGIGINFQGDTGTGLASTDTLTTTLRTTAAFVSGSNAGAANTYGYRNASGHTDLNFATGDARGFGAATANQGVALMIYASSTPVSLQSYSVD